MMNIQNTLPQQEHNVDVCVIGGGMAGICAAIAAARNGATTALIHDRPVLGGNASSEVRMWICGALGKHNKETGILEEIQLENLYHNGALNYSVWDSALWSKVHFQPSLQLFLNCSCLGAGMQDGKITSVTGWQGTSQTMHTVRAKTFIDCSGDSILAALTPAEFRQGRESRTEFDEDIQPEQADSKTMGNSLLIQLRRTDDLQPFQAPDWAYKFTRPEDLPHRMEGVNGENFWWIEVGGLQDTIRDAEAVRDELTRIVYGVWDYIKNYAPEKERAAKWAIEWIGSVPGKRESRRYVGDHTLTQNDIRAGGQFEDIVAYGGWPMDDHHPAGLYYRGDPTIFHPSPSPYGIPLRSLYSRNIPNLLFAGRNISVTHAALSSTRVMGTCAMLGQAAGTAAALCTKYDCEPRILISGDRLAELQRILMFDDCWLPGKVRPLCDLTCDAEIIAEGENWKALRDGWERDREGEDHAWRGPLNAVIEYQWPEKVLVDGVRLVFDSNLAHTKRMPCTFPQKGSASRMPASLVRGFRLEAQREDGEWVVVHRETNNIRRLVVVPLGIEICALRLIPETTWGAPVARVFCFEPRRRCENKLPLRENGHHFSEVRQRISTQDMLAPENGLEFQFKPQLSA
jgi:hypothetical protein